MVTPKPVEPHFAVRQTRRHMSATPLHNFTISDLSVEEYHNLSEEALDLLLTELEGIVEESDQSGWEVEYSSGVLTLNLGDKGTYVLNKQPPNKQIWLSSPLSGPKRYDYDANQRVWFYKHDGKTLGTLLEQELRKLMGQEVKFTLESH
jgi:frataxin